MPGRQQQRDLLSQIQPVLGDIARLERIQEREMDPQKHFKRIPHPFRPGKDEGPEDLLRGNARRL